MGGWEILGSRYRRRRGHHGGRAGGILSIRGPQVSRELLRIGTRHGQTPTPRARALPSVETYEAILSATHLSPAQVPKVLDPELSGEPQAPAHAMYVATHYQSYPRSSPRADLHPKKVNNLGPMAPRPRQKPQLPEGPK